MNSQTNLETADSVDYQIIRAADIANSPSHSSSQIGHCVMEVQRVDGSTEIHESFNARINAGFTAEMGLLFNGVSAASFQYLALSSTSITPAIGDTTLSNEITGNGLARTTALTPSITAPSTPNGQGSIVFTKLFTATATQAVGGLGLFNAVSGGTLYAELSLPNAITLQNGDSVSVAYSLTK